MKKALNTFVLLLLFIIVRAQEIETPFWDEIQNFKKQDSIHFPPKHAILFVGSSSFTKWTDVQDYFPGYPIINRGFGGSSLPDVIRYADDIIFPYHPKQIIIYCGENDLASSDTVSANTVYQRFKTLYSLIRNKLADVPLAYISIKPSPSRQRLMGKMVMANNMIKNFLLNKRNTNFINVYPGMLGKDQSPIQNIYLEDSLHMNANGYKIWQKIIQPYLSK